MSSKESIENELNNVLVNSLNNIDEFDKVLDAKKRGKGVIYNFKTSFKEKEFKEQCKATKNNKGLISSFEFETNIFKYQYKRKCHTGFKFYYKCCPDSADCDVLAYIFATTDSIGVYLSDNHHNHIFKKKRGISQLVKNEIRRLFEIGVTTPKAILRALINGGFEQPSKEMLKNFLVHIRKEKMGSSNINLVELENWCKSRNRIPDEYDTPFVVKFSRGVDSDQHFYFRLLITTRRLIMNMNKSLHLNVDATYKLIHHSFPVLVLGTTDRQKKFHPYGVAITSNETAADFEFVFNCLKEVSSKIIENFAYSPTIVIADDSQAITNGFQDAFQKFFQRRVIYFAHVIRKIDAKLKCFVSPAQQVVKDKIRQDILRLQLAESTEIFNVALKLFMIKWRSYKSKLIDSFLDYFLQEWTINLEGWFEGYAPGLPSTNNFLDLWNHGIESTLGLRHIGDFLTIVEKDMICRWSKDRDSLSENYVKFSEEFQVDHSLYTAAFQWISTIKSDHIIKLKNDDKDFFFTSSKLNNPLDKESASKYLAMKQKLSWKNFDEYSDSCQVVQTFLDKTNWKKSFCICKSFQKNYICIHIIGLAYRYKLISIPDEAKVILFEQKQKRGRPKKNNAFLFYHNEIEDSSSESEDETQSIKHKRH